MSKRRTRHVNDTRVHRGARLQANGVWEPHTTTDGRVFNGRSNKPLRYEDPEEGLAKREENLQKGGENGPSAKMLAIIQSGAVLRPNQIGNVRQGIVAIVNRHLERADRVLAGEEKWAPSQVQLFLGFLHKVAPTMTANLHTIETRGGGSVYSNMTRQELEKQLAETLNGGDKVIDADVDVTEDHKRRKWTDEDNASRRKQRKQKRIGLEKYQAQLLETKGAPPELPPLTRAEDDENRRRSAKAAAGLRKRAERRETLETLRLMGQMDGDKPAEAE